MIRDMITALYNAIKSFINKLIYGEIQTNEQYNYNDEINDVIDTVTTKNNLTMDWENFLSSNQTSLNADDIKTKVTETDATDKSKVIIQRSDNIIKIMINSNVSEMPVTECIKTNKIKWMCTVQKGENISVLTKINYIFGGVTIYTKQCVVDMTLSELTRLHSLNPYIYINRVPKGEHKIYKSNYTNKVLNVYLKLPQLPEDQLIVTKVYSEVQVLRKLARTKRRVTIAIILVIPVIQDAVYIGCQTLVDKAPFIITHLFKHTIPGYVVCIATAIDHFIYEYEISYIAYD